jgi:hypothetical protein
MAGKFKSVDSATKALKVLESNRCVHRIDTTTWVISKIGMEVVRQVGIARKSPLFSRGFG